MKVLWFTLTPCGADYILKNKINTAGWLTALESEIKKQKNIQLTVCFFHDKQVDPFVFENVTYYPIKKSISYGRVLSIISNRILSNFNVLDNKVLPKLVKIINLVGPDLIHIHGTEECFGLIQKHIKTPVVISMQGLLNPYKEKYFAGISSAKASFFESFLSKLALNSTKYKFKLFSKWAKREKEILNLSSNLIGRTDWDRRVSRILATKSNYFVGNEILRASFYSQTWSKEKFSKKLQIVTIMSNGLYKGLETLMKTSLLLKECGFNFTWNVIGQNNNAEYPKIVSKMLGFNFIDINIDMLGAKTESEVVDILCKSDLYCQVSHIENSPNSVCEAMLLGMPIVASNAGGTESILENKIEGVLVQSGEPYSLAGAIVELSEDFELCKQYGKNARTKALARHDKDIIVNNYIEIYKEIIHISKKVI